MVILKIVLAGAAIIALLVVANNQRWAQRAGVVGVCVMTPAPRSQPDGTWYACKEGILNGFPNLEADICTSAGVVDHQEIWSCTGRLTSVPGY